MSVKLTAYQIRQLVEYLDAGAADEEDVTLEVEWLPAGTFLDGERREAGLYFWDTEIPEEGCIMLPEQPETQEAGQK